MVAKGLFMVLSSCNARTMQTRQRSRERFMVLRQVLVNGPMSGPTKVRIFVRRTSGLCSGCKEGPQECKGVRKPLALCECRTINPFMLSTKPGRDQVFSLA